MSIGNLHFAGEAFDTEHAATSMGAFKSGTRAASNIALELEKLKNLFQEPVGHTLTPIIMPPSLSIKLPENYR